MIINNAHIVTLWREKPIVPEALMVIDDKTILDFGRVGKLADRYHDNEVLEANGRVVIPGTINLHSHLYRNFVKGMPFDGARPQSFREWNEQVWWRLDKAMTLEDVHLAAMVGLMDSVRAGVTTVVDLHSSPRSITGSLEAIWNAFDRVGMRGALSYAVSDRLGSDAAQQGLDESANFFKTLAPRSADIRGFMGLEASNLVSDETIASVVARAKELQAPIHMPIAEDRLEMDEIRHVHKKSPVMRLSELGALAEGTLLAHGSLLAAEDAELLNSRGVRVAHCPTTTMSRALSSADIRPMVRAGLGIGMGTDGLNPSLLQEFHTGAQRERIQGSDFKDALRLAFRMAFMENARWASHFFEKPLGVIKPGARADLVVLDYWPSTPLRESNLPEHFFWGMPRASVHSVIVNGRLIFHQGQFVHIDEPALRARAREATRQIWKRT